MSKRPEFGRPGHRLGRQLAVEHPLVLGSLGPTRPGTRIRCDHSIWAGPIRRGLTIFWCIVRFRDGSRPRVNERLAQSIRTVITFHRYHSIFMRLSFVVWLGIAIGNASTIDIDGLLHPKRES